MYQQLGETSDDKTVKEMVLAHLMRLDSLDEREVITRALDEFRMRFGRCPASWRQIGDELRREGLRLDPATATPVDPSGVPYRLIADRCDVDLGEGSKVAR